MVKTEFTHGDVLNLFPEIKGISLIKWVERGLIKPLYEPRTSGGKRLYSYVNLVQIGFINELASYSILSTWIKEYMQNDDVIEIFTEGDFSGVFFEYDRGPMIPGSKADLKENYDTVKNFCRANPATGIYIGKEKKTLGIEGKLSHVVVNLDELQKEIDKRLVQEGWK